VVQQGKDDMLVRQAKAVLVLGLGSGRTVSFMFPRATEQSNRHRWP
jgi:fibrillarin-like rRNA methylase